MMTFGTSDASLLEKTGYHLGVGGGYLLRGVSASWGDDIEGKYYAHITNPVT